MATLKDDYYVDEEGVHLVTKGTQVEVIAEDCPFDGSATVKLVGEDVTFEVYMVDLRYD